MRNGKARAMAASAALLLFAPGAMAVGGAGINFDHETVAMMEAAFLLQDSVESAYAADMREVFSHYVAAEASAAVIFGSKRLDMEALGSTGILGSVDGNRYWRRIRSLVGDRITPMLWRVVKVLARQPHQAFYWASYIHKVATQVEMLCKQFASLVSGSPSWFSGLAFLAVDERYESLFQGDREMVRDILGMLSAAVGTGADALTRDGLGDMAARLVELGYGIASAGVSDCLDGVLSGHPLDAQLRNAAAAVGASLAARLGAIAFDEALKDLEIENTDLARMFTARGLNMSGCETQVAGDGAGMDGTYYTQEWTIFSHDAGSETICEYSPPESPDDIARGEDWYRIPSTAAAYSPTPEEMEAILRNSEVRAGFSRAWVSAMNSSGDGFSYAFGYELRSRAIATGGVVTEWVFACAMTVTRSWDVSEPRGSEMFDSHTMTAESFQARLGATLAWLNSREDGLEYYAVAGEPRPYGIADADRLAGVSSLIIRAHCISSAPMGSSTTQYKCRQCGSEPSDHTRECSMLTSVEDDSLEADGLDARISELEGEIAGLEARIDGMGREIDALWAEWDAASTPAEKALAREGISELSGARDSLYTNVLVPLKESLTDCRAARGELLEGEAVATDDHYRIPAIMADVEAAYGVGWKGPGHWDGFTYVRAATIGSLGDAEVTFRAEVSIARGPKRFLGILIHRAIVQVDWSLDASRDETSVVEVYAIDAARSPEENLAAVNGRLSEIAREWPDCGIETEFVSGDAPVAREEGPSHLLWAGDRVAMAREIERRLTVICAQLTCLERYLHCRVGIVDVLRRYGPRVDDRRGRNLSLAEMAHARWMEAAESRGHPGGWTDGTAPSP